MNTKNRFLQKNFKKVLENLKKNNFSESEKFFKNSNNVFSNIHSINMLCVHRKTKFTLPENWKKLHIDNPNFHPLKKTGSTAQRS